MFYFNISLVKQVKNNISIWFSIWTHTFCSHKHYENDLSLLTKSNSVHQQMRRKIFLQVLLLSHRGLANQTTSNYHHNLLHIYVLVKVIKIKTQVYLNSYSWRRIPTKYQVFTRLNRKKQKNCRCCCPCELPLLLVSVTLKIVTSQSQPKQAAHNMLNVKSTHTHRQHITATGTQKLVIGTTSSSCVITSVP